MKNKKIINYCNSNNYAIMIPVYYEHEKMPSWRKMFTGTLEECEKNFESCPDYIFASIEENKKNRKNKMNEYLLLMSINKIK